MERQESSKEASNDGGSGRGGVVHRKRKTDRKDSQTVTEKKTLQLLEIYIEIFASK